ncbi:TPA: DUF2971 domain-containing protein [Stenotrophomonas maltophilia]|nr:DUF2971 domain-containing protein [Stenotrophomonas maltophilia]
MAIPVSHFWQQRTSDLGGLRELALLAELRAQLPLPVRRARMCSDGVPRHLYKYRSLASDESKQRLTGMLLANELFASAVNKLNDPFDSTAAYDLDEDGVGLRESVKSFFISEGADSELAAALSNDESVSDPKLLAQSLKQGHRSLLEQVGICALSAERRNNVLWSHYGQEHRGVAIQYRPSLDPVAFQVSQVQYSDAYPVVRSYFNRGARNLLAPLLQKSADWKYESEWRLICPGAANRALKVRPESITGVLLGMRISASDRAFLLDLVTRRDRLLSTRTFVYQATATPGAYTVRTTRIL